MKEEYVATPSAEVMDQILSVANKEHLTKQSLPGKFASTLVLDSTGAILFGWLNETAEDGDTIQMRPIPLAKGKLLAMKVVDLIRLCKDTASLESGGPDESAMNTIQIKVDGSELAIFYDENYTVCYRL